MQLPSAVDVITLRVTMMPRSSMDEKTNPVIIPQQAGCGRCVAAAATRLSREHTSQLKLKSESEIIRVVIDKQISEKGLDAFLSRMWHCTGNESARKPSAGTHSAPNVCPMLE